MTTSATAKQHPGNRSKHLCGYGCDFCMSKHHSNSEVCVFVYLVLN